MKSKDQSIPEAANRYAKALFQLAEEENSMNSVSKDLDGFLKAVESSEDLSRLVNSPMYSEKEQSDAINAILKKMKVNELISKFIGLLIQNRRINSINYIVAAFHRLLAIHSGEVIASIVSAEDLNKSQIDKLTKNLKEMIGKNIKLDLETDPKLLGGLIVKVGSQMIDNSLETKLNNIKIAMKGVS